MVKKIKADITERTDLLFDFIAEKYHAYEEPERKGTPRGEKIGFSKKKYMASLLVGLINLKPKEMAETVGKKFDLTHGLLRKWKTEDDFKEQSKGHIKEFAGLLFKKLEEGNKKHHKAYNEYFNCKTDKKPDIPQSIEKIYGNSEFYSSALLEELSSHTSARVTEAKINWDNDKKEQDSFFIAYSILNDVLRISHRAAGERTPEYIKLKYFKVSLSQAKAIIASKRVLSKSEQRIIVDLLENVEESLNEMIEKEV